MAKKEKPSIRSIKKPSLKGKGSSLAFALLALVLTIVVFGGLLFLQNFFTEEIVYKSVVVAKVDIPENEIITADNAASYFEIKNMNVLDTNNGSMDSVDSILGQKAKVSFYAGEIISAKDFENISTYTRDFNDPVEISVEVGAVADSDGGKIRTGDVVNLTMMFTKDQLGMTNSLSSSSNNMFSISDMSSDDDLLIDEDVDLSDDEDILLDEEEPDVLSEEPDVTLTNTDMETANSSDGKYIFDYYAKYIVQDLYVEKALDSSGNEIAPTDTASVASILVFVIERDEEAAINNALANCSNIRVSKVVTKDSSVSEAVTLPLTEEEKPVVDDTVEEQDSVAEENVENTVEE